MKKATPAKRATKGRSAARPPGGKGRAKAPSPRKAGGKIAADWRAEALARVRALIREADPEIVETVKWKKPSAPAGVPVWEKHGILCTGETYRDKVKLTFACGAALKDPSGLFNAGLDGNVRRAIDIPEGAAIDAKAFKALIRAAAALNAETAAARRSAARARPRKKRP